MPRKPGRPVPTIGDLFTGEESFLSPSLTPELAPHYYAALSVGLMKLLERIEPRYKQLKEELDISVRQFRWTSKKHGKDAASADLVTWILNFRPTRKNVNPCRPLLLLSHHALTVKTLQGLPDPQNLNEARKAVRALLEKLASGYYRCTCARQTTLPKDFNKQIEIGWNPGDMAEYLLAHHHCESRDVIHRQLAKGTAQLCQIRQSRRP